VPAIFRAVFAAINYTLAPWKPEAFGPVYHESERVEGPPDNPFSDGTWADTVARALSEGDARFSGVSNRPYTASGITLWLLRTRGLDPKTPRPERQKARQELETEWKKLGEDAGVLPVTRSDKAHSIPLSQLRKLADSGKVMLDELRRYKIGANQKDAVRAMLSAPPFVVANTKWEAVQHSKREQERVAGAARRVYQAKYREALRNWEEAAQLDFWCVQLAFPMLTRDEIVTARPRLEESVKSPKRGHYWLFTARFGLDPDRVREELARNRPS
jgi:hypothetical protein